MGGPPAGREALPAAALRVTISPKQPWHAWARDGACIARCTGGAHERNVSPRERAPHPDSALPRLSRTWISGASRFNFWCGGALGGARVCSSRGVKEGRRGSQSKSLSANGVMRLDLASVWGFKHSITPNNQRWNALPAGIAPNGRSRQRRELPRNVSHHLPGSHPPRESEKAEPSPPSWQASGLRGAPPPAARRPSDARLCAVRSRGRGEQRGRQAGAL